MPAYLARLGLALLVAVIVGATPARAAAHQATPAAGSPTAGATGAAIEPLIRATVDDPPTRPIVVQIARLTYAPGAELLTHTTSGPLLLVGEAGTFTVHVAGPSAFRPKPVNGTPVPPVMTSLGESAGPIGTRLTLTPGDQLVIPTDTPRAYRNDGTVPAAVLAVQVYPDAPQGSPFPPGVVVDPLATGLLPAPSAPLTVVLDRVVVPRGGAVSPRTPSAPEIVYVETGTLQATVEGAPAEIQRGPVAVATGAESGMTGNGDHVLPPGFGLFAEPGATMTLRNTADDPLTLLVLTVAPAGDATPVVTLSGP